MSSKRNTKLPARLRANFELSQHVKVVKDPAKAHRMALEKHKGMPDTLKKAKAVRDSACASMYPGSTPHEYSTDIPLFSYGYYAQFMRGKPFAKKDCVPFGYDPRKMTKDKTRYSHVRTRAQCAQTKGGVWDPSTIANGRVGVCWRNLKEKTCASQGAKAVIEPHLVRFRELWRTDPAFRSNTPLGMTRRRQYDTMMMDLARQCKAKVTDPPCKWDVATKRCVHDRAKNLGFRLAAKAAKLRAAANRAKDLAWRKKQKNFADRKRRERAGQKAKNWAVRAKAQRVRRDLQVANLQKRIKLRRGNSLLLHGLARWRKQASKFPKWWPSDYTGGDIQSDLARLYDDKAYAPKYSALQGGDVDRCSGPGAIAGDLATLPQTVVWTLMRGMQHTGSKNRGVLAFHSTGSGKTNLASGLIEMFFRTEKNIVFATSIDAIRTNSPKTFAKNMLQFHPKFKAYAQSRAPKGSDLADFVVTMMERRVTPSGRKSPVRFVSFAQLSNMLQLVPNRQRFQKWAGMKEYLNDAVLVIDEVQNLFKPSVESQKADNLAVRRFLATMPKGRADDLKVVIMTATPGQTPEETVELLNIVRDPRRPKIQVPKTPADLAAFKQSIAGLVSFFDGSGDLTKFPRVRMQDTYTFPMSKTQLQGYLDAYKDDSKKAAASHAGDKYWQKTRKYSLAAKPPAPRTTNRAQLAEFSPKIAKFVDLLEQFPKEKHWAYSAFFTKGQAGVMLMADILEHHGYSVVTPDDVLKMWDFSAGAIKAGVPKAKRYVLATNPRLKFGGGSKDTTTVKLAGGRTMQLTAMDALRLVFNSKENRDGAFVQVMLASQKYNEGVDLRAVRHVHLMEPLLSKIAEKQAIGRAARYCSHSDLSRKDGQWSIQVHRYVSLLPTPNHAANNAKSDQAIRNLEAKIDSLRAELRAKEAAGKGTKTLEKSIETQQRKLAKIASKAANSAAPADADAINLRVLNRSENAMTILDQVQQALRDAAVDCKLLGPGFHNAAGIRQTCGAGNRRNVL
jgi:hypothetical protein